MILTGLYYTSSCLVCILQNTAICIKDMQILTWGSYIRRNLPPDLGTEKLLAKKPDGPAEMGPSPVILLALEGEENILPLQSEYFTNLYILRIFFDCESNMNEKILLCTKQDF